MHHFFLLAYFTEWLLAPGAEQHFAKVFGNSLKSFVNGSGHLDLIGKCNTEEKLKAGARVLAANVEIVGWSGKLL